MSELNLKKLNRFFLICNGIVDGSFIIDSHGFFIAGSSVAETSTFLWKYYLFSIIIIHTFANTVVAVTMHSPKKVLPSTYFRGNKYSPVYISQVKLLPGLLFF